MVATNEKPLEQKIMETIVKHSMNDWLNYSNVDVVIVGAGPAGLATACCLAKKRFKVIVIERRLSFGGGIGGGGMLFQKIVSGLEAKEVLDDIGVDHVEWY